MTDDSKNLGTLFKPKPGEIVVVCAWCVKEIRRKPGDGETGISHGICASCLQKLKGGSRDGNRKSA